MVESTPYTNTALQLIDQAVETLAAGKAASGAESADREALAKFLANHIHRAKGSLDKALEALGEHT